MKVEPYLMFEGRCDEAIEFYRAALDVKDVYIMRFKDCPDPAMRPATGGDQVMHASFRIGDTTVMASDGRCSGSQTFSGISLTISVASEAEAEKVFAALGDGGRVQMPLTKTFFSPRFGMVADRFGVSWMIIVGS